MGVAPIDHAFATALVSVLAQRAAIVDINGGLLSWNADFLSCLSITPAHVLGAKLWGVLRESDRADVCAFFKDAPSGRTSILTKVATASGQFKLSVNAITDTSPRGLFLCQLTPDVAIDSSRLRFLLERLDQGVWNYNTLSNVFEVTDAWRRMRGMGLNDDVRAYNTDPENWLECIHSEDREMIRDLFLGQVHGTKDSYSAQYRRWHPDGRWIWISCRANVMSYDQNGQPVQIIGLDTDITEIKENEAELLKLSNKMQLAIMAAGIGVWEFDAATGIEEWDERMFGIYGLTSETDREPSDIWETYLHPDDAAETRRYSLQCITDNKDFARDYRIIRVDGDVRHVRSHARFVQTAGTGGKMLGVNIDVTDDYLRAEELERARELLEHDSRHDALTGLANRRLLDETTQDVLGRLGDGEQFAVLHIDLDHFKQINDTLGHAAGDKVLVQVAENLRDLVGDRGLVCRIGGDEFVVLLEDFATLSDVHLLCERIIARMAEPVDIENQVNTFGVSIGCALARGGIEDASEVFINADIALYAAKSDGRSCFRSFSTGLRSAALIDAHAHHNLRAALSAGQIICHFQPQFDAETREIVGAEALVRWTCPERSVMGPDDFLPLAKNTGLLPRIDEFVFDFVLKAQTRWADAGLEVPIVALNISLERLLEPSLLQQVRDGMQPHHALSFELLETAFLDTCEDGLGDVLDELRDAGIRLDLDDFGSGRSSIVALQTVKPDRVKFDQMLIAPLEKNPAQILILEALVQVAQLEGCGVVVEGRETQRQLEMVANLNCEALHGYLLGRPVPEDEFVMGLRLSDIQMYY